MVYLTLLVKIKILSNYDFLRLIYSSLRLRIIYISIDILTLSFVFHNLCIVLPPLSPMVDSLSYKEGRQSSLCPLAARIASAPDFQSRSVCARLCAAFGLDPTMPIRSLLPELQTCVLPLLLKTSFTYLLYILLAFIIHHLCAV